MPWPLSQDYNEAIQTPVQCFADPELQRGEAVTNALGLPMPCSGNFADVYAVQSGTQKWAVKCFTRQIQGLRERYAEISKYLQRVQLPFMVDFKFLEQGIRVRGQWYPILKMQWVEGQTLNAFVRSQLDNPTILRTISQLWAKMGGLLREANLAHGDLQHGNVLLVPGSKAGTVGLKLVDYDGMCVPALELLKAAEVGHPAYQHPQRLREATYGLHIDRFSLLVIYTALRAVAVGGRKLWERFDNGDNLLFSQKDFENPKQSALFGELSRLNNPELAMLVPALIGAAQKPVEQAPQLGDLLPAEGPKAASSQPRTTPSTAGGNPGRAEAGVFLPPAKADPGRSNMAAPADTQRNLQRWVIAGVAAGVFGVCLVAAVAVLLLAGGDSDPPRGGATAARNTSPTTAGTKPTPSTPTPSDPSWVQLFNGRDLQGWTERSAAPGAWTVSNGILSGARDAGFLYSQRGDYRNFHFRIEARLERNSLGGQGFRAVYRTLPHGYYVQSDIGRAPPGNKTGSLFIARDFGEITQLAGVREVLSPNEWYTQEIVAVDNRLTVFVNERRVVDYIDAKSTFTSGHVTLFTASAPIQYRKVEIRELKNAPPGR